MKTTSNGRGPPIYDKNHLLDHTQILNLSLYDQTIFCKSSKWRKPPMEDNLKIYKVEYLSNRLLDHAQILNLDLGDHWPSSEKLVREI